MKLSELYSHSPVPLQNVFATGYGLRELPRRHGGRFRNDVTALVAREWWDTGRLDVDQESRLRAMITWCGARVPYYRDLFVDLGLDPRDIRTVADLQAIPMLDKEVVRAAPDRFLPDEPRPKLLQQSTGGTTGTPVRYWATREAVQQNYAVYEARTRGWAGVRFGERMASLHGQPIVPESQRGAPYWRRNLAFNQLYFSVYHLNSATLPDYVEALERFSPAVIAGYTTAVHRIARHLVDSGDIGRVAPRAVLVSSETLTPAARADMELAFGCRVTNSYSLGELVAYISECPHGEMHISTEYGAIELVESAVGCEIVATTLINRGMPLLRYRTGDLVVPIDDVDTSTCGRGLPRVSEVVGRIDDVVHTPEGATVGPAPMSLAFQRVPHLRRAQVRQDSVDEITVLMEVADGFHAADSAHLESELRLRLGPSISLRLERVDALPRTAGGKERLVVSTLTGRPERG